MTPPSQAHELERRYRRLLRLLPPGYRAAREEEMLAVLLAGAGPGQRRPAARDVTDLLRTAARLRLRQLLLVDPVARLGVVAATALLVVGGLLFAQVYAARGALGAADAEGTAVTLPAELPPWWPVPASASGSPGGAAIAYFGTGDEDGQPYRMLVSATGNSLRKAPRVATDGTGQQIVPRSRARTLLSPDGRLLATMGNTGKRVGNDADGMGRLAVLDLTTGVRRPLPGREFSTADALLAWSRDGSRLAWARDGRMEVLDRRTGRIAALGEAPSTAAYATTDDRLAVVRGDALEVLDDAGRVLSTQQLTSTLEIARAGWSPDGARIALARPAQGSARVGLGTEPPPAFVITSADGDGTDARTVLESAEPLAWAGEDELLLSSDSGVERYDLSTGARHPAAGLQLPSGSWSDEYWDLQLATALVPDAEVVARGRAERGPMSTRWYAIVAFLILVGAGAAVKRGPSKPPAWRRYRWPSLVGLGLVGAALSVLFAVPLLWLYVVFTFGLGPDQPIVHAGVLCLVAAAYVATRSVLRAGETAYPAPSTLP